MKGYEINVYVFCSSLNVYLLDVNFIKFLVEEIF